MHHKPYTEAVADTKARHERELKRMDELQEIYKVAIAAGKGYDAGEADVKVGLDTWLGDSTVEIDVHLAAGQHINWVKPLVKRLAATRLFRPAHFQDSNAHAYVYWDFRPRDEAVLAGKIRVGVWYANSGVCRLEPTGETKPIMKLVCDGNDIPMSEGEQNGGT